MSERPAAFISHASLEDNAFTIWLGLKLAAASYEVRADILRLTGGDDWQRKSEDAFRNRACKVLLVANQKSVDKQGVRNEIRIASDAAKKISDKRFIIPFQHQLKPGPCDAPFLFPAVCASRQALSRMSNIIDFSHGWSSGPHELLSALQDEYRIPLSNEPSTATWSALAGDARQKARRASRATGLNWLRVRKLPEEIHDYHNAELEQRHAAILAQRSTWRRLFGVRRTSHRPCRQGFTERCPQRTWPEVVGRRWLAGAGYPEYGNAEDVPRLANAGTEGFSGVAG